MKNNTSIISARFVLFVILVFFIAVLFTKGRGNTSGPVLIGKYKDGSLSLTYAQMDDGTRYYINWHSVSGEPRLMSTRQNQVATYGRGSNDVFWFIENHEDGESRNLRFVFRDGSERVKWCEDAATALQVVELALRDGSLATEEGWTTSGTL
ncbi:hypothetical protein [Roseibacillus persicicus]|uniref:hypothetical protein n=1 Tax=Roseibacillus persicicus TaxID=454148 RepID=UPI001679ED2C|nr:hypothetical protein [Roseibacillus persicicus]